MADKSCSFPLDKAERERLRKLYWVEKYLFEDVHDKFKTGELIDDFDFYSIIYWKRNPSKPKIRDVLAELGKGPQDLLDEVRKAEGDKAKVEVLTKVKHIGPAIASAILAVCYPDDFTVVDQDVLTLVKDWGWLSDDSLTRERYLEYNQKCKEWSGKLGMTLREMDRVLWAKAWKKRLERWLSETDQ
ncbi:MAG: hypothetical protein WBH57_02020 [Anaerolineae bacterium]